MSKNEIHIVRKGKIFEGTQENGDYLYATFSAKEYTIRVYNEDGTMFDIGTATDGICVTKPEGTFEHIYEDLHVFTKFTRKQLDYVVDPLKFLREFIIDKAGE